MRHYSEDYLLASCFKCFDDKLVRFFVPGGMVDVGIKASDKDEMKSAREKNRHFGFDYDDYSKAIWQACDHVINNMLETNTKEDFIDSLGSSKIEIVKIDYYTVKITLRVSNKNQSNTNSIILDNYDGWFISKLVSFVQRTLTRKIFDR